MRAWFCECDCGDCRRYGIGATKMEAIILFYYLLCSGSDCRVVPFAVSREALAIISCESGDGHNYGTYTTQSRSKTHDGGLFQFNDKTYLWLMGTDHAQRDSYENQYTAFRRLWSDGTGWKHWKSSQACWSQWMVVVDDKAVWQ